MVLMSRSEGKLDKVAAEISKFCKEPLKGIVTT